MSSIFRVYYEDALDHCTDTGAEYTTYEEAKKEWDACVKAGPSGYDIGVELAEVVNDYEDIITHEYHEWFTQEEWEEAHPNE